MGKVQLSEEIIGALKEVRDGGNLVHLATATIEGKPNLVAMRFVRTHDKETVVIADMYFGKTKVNIKENTSTAISIVHPNRQKFPYIVYGKGYYAEKGSAGKAGEIWARWKDWGEKSPPTEVPEGFAPPNPSARGILYIEVEKIVKTTEEEFGKEA